MENTTYKTDEEIFENLEIDDEKTSNTRSFAKAEAEVIRPLTSSEVEYFLETATAGIGPSDTIEGCCITKLLVKDKAGKTSTLKDANVTLIVAECPTYAITDGNVLLRVNKLA